MKKIIFAEQNLIDLLLGEIVEIDGVQIILEDIGFDRIAKAIIKGMK